MTYVESSGEMVMSLRMRVSLGCGREISRRMQRPEESVESGDFRPVFLLTLLATFLASFLN